MRTFLIFLIFLTSCFCLAQDERFYRKEILTGLDKKILPEDVYKFIVRSDAYQLDVNDDGYMESFYVIKGDGDDLVEIQDQSGRRLFQEKLTPTGKDSYLYKINELTISPSAKLYLLHFYEGYTSYVNLDAVSRVYFLTIDNQDSKTISLFKGPAIMLEKELRGKEYHFRSYKVAFEDLNSDRTKEVIIKHNNLSRVYFYLGNGSWQMPGN